MHKIEEIRKYFGKAYYVESGNNKREIYIISHIKKMDDFTYMFITDSYGNTIKNAYRYLNYNLERSTYKKRELALTALKCLYSFMEVFNISSPELLDKTYGNRLVGFMQGGEFKSVNVEYHLNTERRNSTINNYFAVYRAYFKYLNYDNGVFSDSSTLHIQKGGGNNDGFFAHAKRVKIEKFDISLKIKQKMDIPKYIRFHEYKEILDLIDVKYSLREKIIIKLMYENGLRIGEVLGLTLEDFVYDEELYNSGDCSLILRNRFSDRPYQFAKSCMKITNKIDYNNEYYNKEDIGYQRISITSELAQIIQDYIDITRSPFEYVHRHIICRQKDRVSPLGMTVYNLNIYRQ